MAAAGSTPQRDVATPTSEPRLSPCRDAPPPTPPLALVSARAAAVAAAAALCSTPLTACLFLARVTYSSRPAPPQLLAIMPILYADLGKVAKSRFCGAAFVVLFFVGGGVVRVADRGEAGWLGGWVGTVVQPPRLAHAEA